MRIKCRPKQRIQPLLGVFRESSQSRTSDAYPDFAGTWSVVDPHPVVGNQNDRDSDEEEGLDHGDENNCSNDLGQRSNEHADRITENVVDGIHV